ncbi:MAG: diaminopimelate epimerase [Acidimicrobiales bacterium]
MTAVELSSDASSMAPTAVRLTKHHGLGNDFLIAIDPARPLGPADAVAWCDRRTGLGADGLIQVDTIEADPGRPQAHPAAPWRMTLWNADGSEAEISGNGVRCVGQAIVLHDGLSGAFILDVDTASGVRRLEVVDAPAPELGGGAAFHSVRVDMGAPRPGGPEASDRWSAAGVDVFRQEGIDMGNPHLVALVDDPATIDLAVVGPTIEAQYPAGCNVHVVRIEDASTIDLRVWERGAGITEACGSGACAAAVAGHRWGLTSGRVQVVMPGGAVEVEVTDDTVHLTGPATFVATIDVPITGGDGEGGSRG